MNQLVKFLLQIILFLILFQSIYVSASWYDASWPLKQELNVSTSGNAPINYSVLINLNSTNIGPGFNWNNECSLNSTKTIFVNDENNHVYPYWVENCSSINQEMNIWIKLNDTQINSSGVLVNMYYNNIFTPFQRGNGSDVFEFFGNFSNYLQESESAGQDTSGSVLIENQGTQLSGSGNFWKVYSGFDNIDVSNTGNQILELDMYANDCGEISAFKFDTDTTQENTGAYRFCGSQTNWGIIPDQTYSTLGSWSKVSSVLNDFSISATHIHFVGDDDGDASTDIKFRNVKIRKYIVSEPQTSFGLEYAINTTVTSLFPLNNSIYANNTLNFTCYAGSGNTTELKNISLFGSWGSGWEVKQTNNISGNVNVSTFSEVLPPGSGTYTWNCGVYNIDGGFDMFDQNYTISVDVDPPTINLFSPLNITSDPTPLINVSSNKNVNFNYTINLSISRNLCLTCNSSSNISEHLAEGSYNLTIFATDSIGNFNEKSYLFRVDLNNSYHDIFSDLSSIDNLDNSYLNNSKLEFSGSVTSEYEGIQLGYQLGNLNYIGNQWGGSGNAGEVDIECPGGDSNCWFVNQNGTNITSLNIDNGVVTLDSDSSTVGFVMYSEEDVHTRFTPTPHPQEGDNFVAVCFISGQWYYDDNNGCNDPFTPRPSDILLANLTWGITSVSSLEGLSFVSSSEVISKSINVTSPIVIFDNVSWDQYNTNTNNTVNVQLSVDNGLNWYNVSNGASLTNFTNGTSLKFKVNFNGDGSQKIGFDNLNITWRNYLTQIPELTLLTPINGTKLLQNEGINFSYYFSDDNDNVSCIFYINDAINSTQTCQNNQVNTILVNLTRGEYNWSINLTDQDNNTIIKSENFSIINPSHKKISKKISSFGSNFHSVNLTIENNLLENNIFLEREFTGVTFGSFSPIFTSTYLLDSNTFYIFNGSSNVSYSIGGSQNYSLLEAFVVNLD